MLNKEVMSKIAASAASKVLRVGEKLTPLY